MNSDFFKNTSTEGHVDLRSVHMTVKQPINSVKKKINWFNKNIKQAVCCHEDQTTVWQNFYFLINGVDVHKHCCKLTRPRAPHKKGPSGWMGSYFSKRAQMKTSTWGQDLNLHFAALPTTSNFFLNNLLRKEICFGTWYCLSCSTMYHKWCRHHTEQHLVFLPLKQR